MTERVDVCRCACRPCAWSDHCRSMRCLGWTMRAGADLLLVALVVSAILWIALVLALVQGD